MSTNYLNSYREGNMNAAEGCSILPYQKSSIINCVEHIDFGRLAEIAEPMINSENLPDSFVDPCDGESLSELFVKILEQAFDNINRTRGIRKTYNRTEPLLADRSLVYDVYANINGACSIRIVPIIGYSKGIQRHPASERRQDK